MVAPPLSLSHTQKYLPCTHTRSHILSLTVLTNYTRCRLDCKGSERCTHITAWESALYTTCKSWCYRVWCRCCRALVCKYTWINLCTIERQEVSDYLNTTMECNEAVWLKVTVLVSYLDHTLPIVWWTKSNFLGWCIFVISVMQNIENILHHTHSNVWIPE